MNDVTIRLNFFRFADQDFSFSIYRRRYDRESDFRGLYRCKLPVEVGSNEYADFCVAPEQFDQAELFECDQQTNPLLTKKVVWWSFLQKLADCQLIEDRDYFLTDHGFDRYVDIVLAKHAQGHACISLRPYYLRAYSQFGLLGDFHFVLAAGQEFDSEVQRLSLSLDANFRSNKNYYSDKYDKLCHFRDNLLPEISPLQIGERHHDLSAELQTVSHAYLAGRVYQFAESAENNSQFNGLVRNAPLESVTREPMLLFIFPDQLKQYANEVYTALIGKSFPATFPGMKKMFGIDIGTGNVDKIVVPSYDHDALAEIGPNLDRLCKKHEDKRIIGIFLEHAQFKTIHAGYSPYYFIKRLFIKRRLPVQAITFENIGKKDGLKWSAANIGLQIFAKLGGVPWKVKPSTERCVIFGIGSAHELDDNGSYRKYLAYSVCLDSSGIYRRLDVLGESENRQSYLADFKGNIIQAIANQLDNATNFDTCVIHVPFKVRRDELDEIRSGLNQLVVDHKEVTFACIKVNTNNKFFGFANTNSRVPYESTLVELSDREYLIWLEGLHFGKETVYKRIGNPIHVEFLYFRSPDNSDARIPHQAARKAYLQDIINLSGANWRGFNAKLAPISIYYPQLIAKYVMGFKALGDGDEVAISDLGEPWFL